MPTWLQETQDGILLSLHIQPNAKKTQIAGLHGDALKIRLAAPPVDGKANKALIVWLAKLLGVSRSAVTITSGAKSRHKKVTVEGDSSRLSDAIERRLVP